MEMLRVILFIAGIVLLVGASAVQGQRPAGPRDHSIGGTDRKEMRQAVKADKNAKDGSRSAPVNPTQRSGHRTTDHTTTMPTGLEASKRNYGLPQEVTEIVTFEVTSQVHGAPSSSHSLVGNFSVGIFGNSVPPSVVATFKSQCQQIQASPISFERVVSDLVLIFGMGGSPVGEGSRMANSPTGLKHRVGSVGTTDQPNSFYILLDPAAADVLNAAQKATDVATGVVFAQVLDGWTTTVNRVNRVHTSKGSKPDNFDLVLTACSVERYKGPVQTDQEEVPVSDAKQKRHHHSRGEYLKVRNAELHTEEVTRKLKEHGLLQ